MERAILGALALREKNGRHMHHSECIHNLPPEEQIEMRGKTVEWWMAVVGSMPVQITPDEWEIVGPGESATETRRIDEREESQ